MDLDTNGFFRANVAIVLTNGMKVLVFRRSDIPDAWQFPQGGIQSGESVEQAAWRELEEETRLTPADVGILNELHEWLVYELPVDSWTSKTGRGQAQRFLLFSAATDVVARVSFEAEDEFAEVKWVSPADAIEQAVDFRKNSYSRALTSFGLLS